MNRLPTLLALAATLSAHAASPEFATATTATAGTPAASGTTAVAAAAGPATHAALVKSVTGKVRVMRAGAALDLVAGMPLQATDRLVSERGASAGLVFRDGTLLTVGPAAEVELRQYVFEPTQAKYAFSVYLAKGSAIYESGKIGKVDPGAVRVDTPTATVGVRGTRFIVTAEE